MGNLLKLIGALSKRRQVTHFQPTGLDQIAIPACARLLYRLESDWCTGFDQIGVPASIRFRALLSAIALGMTF
jgi:hypothetical protein